MIGVYLYLTLVLIGIILVGLSYWKTKNKMVFALFLALSGCIALFDYVIYVWGIAYVYRPGFVNNEMDKQLGALVSDFFSVPASAVFIVAYRLRWYWVIFISALYFGIEELFLKFGVYEQFWWKTWYTFVFLLILFWIAKVWYDRLNSAHGRILEYVTLISILLVEIVPIIIVQAFFENREVVSEWIKSLGRQGPVINVPICLTTSIIFTFLIFRKAKKIWMVITICSFFLFDLILRKLNIVESKFFWDNIYSISLDIGTLILGIYFSKLLQRKRSGV